MYEAVFCNLTRENELIIRKLRKLRKNKKK